MELEVLFGNLVHNRYMEHFNYRTRFKFQTVFNKTLYSYSCCPCGFEHEFLDYIGDKGDINEEVYGKIVQSITEGKCPHVTPKVPIEWVTETSVTGLHVAVALGTEIGDIKRKEITKNNEGIFGVNLQSIAHMKMKNESIASTVKDFVHCFSKLPENTSIITVKKVSYFEALVQTRDSEWLRKCLKLTDQKPVNVDMEASLSKAFEFTLNHGLTDLTDVLLDYMEQEQNIYASMRPTLIISVIMYNKPEILEQILDSTTSTVVKESELDLDDSSSRICDIVNRPECKKVFLERGLHEENGVSDFQIFLSLLTLLKNYFDTFKEEIVEALKQIPHVEKYAITFFQGTDAVATKPKIVKAVLDLGVDIALLKSTIFLRITQHNYVSLYKIQTRESVKVLVNANPDFKKNETVVPFEFSKDSQLHDDSFQISKVGTYLADVREHGRFGYQGGNFALNFSGPFFLECGFPVKREVLEKYLNEETLHPAIHDYIKCYIDKNFDNPKPLMIQCREFLRRHFKGKALHSFIEKSDCPESVKDFVLMKYLLQPLKQ